MAKEAQNYYHSLGPFLPLMATGRAILMYHKLGPRPRGVRIKGLYVATRLFARQLAELSAGGFGTVSLSAPMPAPGNPQRLISITFDDGFRNVLAHGLKPLAAHHFRAINFIVAGLIGKTNEWDLPRGEAPERLMDEHEIRDWLAAGHEIGSHALTHPHLHEIPLAAAREEIFASKKRLEDTFGLAIEHFCYPYGDQNEAVRALVAEAGYATACATTFGVNTDTTPRLALNRFAARYPSRRLSAWISRWFHRPK
jgi:peptidoglycan/xylan/chitin deacetylase (PgdA/CDA1 family)